MNLYHIFFSKVTWFIFLVSFLISLELVQLIKSFMNVNIVQSVQNQSYLQDLQNLINSSTKLSIEYSENIDSGSGVYKAFWVKDRGTLLTRVTKYNQAINNFRKELINIRGASPWRPPGVFKTYRCHQDNFQNRLENYPVIKTIALAWDHDMVGTAWDSSVDISNLLIQQYYPWTGSERLCTMINTAGFTKAHFDAIYNRSCIIFLNETLRGAENLNPVYLHGKPIGGKVYWPHGGLHYPDYFYTTTPPHVLYLHILEDAIVTSVGDVMAGNVQLVPYTCSHEVANSPPRYFNILPLYEEVFIISQFWGEGFFHAMVEDLPRLAPYLEFLKTNPKIMIHAQRVGGFTAQSLEVLGLNTKRLVAGPIRAHRVYLPQGTPCGFANVHEIQIIAHHYKNYIDLLPIVPAQMEPSILLIRRSKRRYFLHHQRILEELKLIAQDYKLKFEVFIDNPSPPRKETMLMFHRAFMVVGPHGAGLSNLVYSQHGTLVIEGVCNPPIVNMCYQRTAYLLGMRYHGIVSKQGCEKWVDVGHEQVSSAARHLLAGSGRTKQMSGLKNMIG